MNRTAITLGVVAALAAASVSPSAAAVTVTRDSLSHGTANCQSALPVFDGNIRKRPAAVANEGTGIAFVTCDSENISNSGTGFSAINVFFRNRAGADGITVSCTLVDAVFTAGLTVTKVSGAMAAGGAIGLVSWGTADNSGNNIIAPAVSCALPPGVDISFTNFVYPVDVGA
jgi:hypothetical protein